MDSDTILIIIVSIEILVILSFVWLIVNPIEFYLKHYGSDEQKQKILEKEIIREEKDKKRQKKIDGLTSSLFRKIGYLLFVIGFIIFLFQGLLWLIDGEWNKIPFYVVLTLINIPIDDLLTSIEWKGVLKITEFVLNQSSGLFLIITGWLLLFFNSE